MVVLVKSAMLSTTICSAPLKGKEAVQIKIFRVKADFHSVQNVARSIFIERFLLKCVKSTTANEICSA